MAWNVNGAVVYADKNGSTIATVKPTDLLASTGTAPRNSQQRWRKILAIINEAAWLNPKAR